MSHATQVLDQVFLVRRKGEPDSLFVPFILDGRFGVVRLPMVRATEPELNIKDDKWAYKLKRAHSSHVIEVSPALDMFYGQVGTDELWRRRVVFVHADQVRLIYDWVENLNEIYDGKYKPDRTNNY